MLCGTFWRKALKISRLFAGSTTALGQDSAENVQSAASEFGPMFHKQVAAR
jgi:hypothetical protein